MHLKLKQRLYGLYFIANMSVGSDVHVTISISIQVSFREIL